ncbi:MAG: hypothetical protein ACUVRD_06280 [Bacteroidia bacterium]
MCLRSGWRGLLVLGSLWAQGVFEKETPFFRGVIQYTIYIKGEKAQQLKLNDPPTAMDLYIQEGNFLVNEHGGSLSISRLYRADSDWVYVLDPRNKRVFKYEKYRPSDTLNPQAEFTGDTLRILGRLCYGFRVQKPDEEIIYYVDPLLRVNTAYYKGKKQARAFFLVQGLYGAIPLQVIRKQKDLTITVRAKRVQAINFDPESFQIPKGYSMWGYDYRR